MSMIQGDRFIPARASLDVDRASIDLSKENEAPYDGMLSPTKQAYHSALNHGTCSSSKILTFQNKAPAPKEGHISQHKVLYTQNKRPASSAKPTRSYPQTPFRTLDAPELVDDYYLNLLDWSQDDVLAIALGQHVHIWNAASSSITQLTPVDPQSDNFVTSVGWSSQSGVLAVGTTTAEVQLWDVATSRVIRTLKGHQARVGALAWNQCVLSTGSRDTTIQHHDVRIQNPQIAILNGHTQEVCGLKWSHDGSQLASGGNDNVVNIWDGGSTTAKFRLEEHTAAVRAVAWCPFQANTLATGGGTADRTIKIWNTQSGACLSSTDTGSQVCGIQWNSTYKELISSHGFAQNQLCVWKYPTMTKAAELTGHTSRALHLAISPDGTTVASAAADETLKFWKVFENTSAPASKVAKKAPAPQENRLLSSTYLR